MGMPHSVPVPRPTKATTWLSVEEIKSLYGCWRGLVPKDYVVHEDQFAAYCLWSQICRPETARVLFGAFDTLKRGFFDFEDFAQTAGALSRGTADQVSEVLYRMLATPGPAMLPEQQGAASAAAAAASPAYVVRYADVITALKSLDVSFLCLRADGGIKAESVAARLPFDEFGHLSLEELRLRVQQQL